MSTVFATLIDNLRAEIPTITGFSTKKELTNPYVIENNASQLLRGGWGLRVGGSTIISGELSRTTSENEIGVVLTWEVNGMDISSTNLTTTIKAAKSDISKIVNRLSAPGQYTYPAGVIDVAYTSTDPIEYDDATEKLRYIRTTVNFTVILAENLD